MPSLPERSFLYAYAGWLIATVGTLMSLFFSEVMELPPCTLCWYQRICLFPLTVVIAAGIIRRDEKWVWYAAPLALAGLALSIYHNGIYYGFISEALSPCTLGVSCATRQIEWFGFLTIPTMAFLAFFAILGCVIAHIRTEPA